MNTLYYTSATYQYPEISFQFRVNNKNYSNKIFVDEIDIKLWQKADPKILATLINHIGLAFIPYLFGINNFSDVYIEHFSLSNDQKHFFEDYFLKGLAEFRYRNRLDVQQKITLHSSDKYSFQQASEVVLYDKALVLNGGGKDSVVSGEALKSIDYPFTWFVLNHTPSRERSIEISANPNAVFVRWQLDPHIKQDSVYKGHKPLSAMLSFLGVLAAYLTESKYIVSANEYSANFGNVTVQGFEVNHQYTKSFEFEQAFSLYVKTYLVKDLHYFSILRPLYELQIAHLFSKFPEYFPYIVSCNQGQREGIWCKNCSKCAFVFLILYPFLNKHQILEIFNQNLFYSLHIHIKNLILEDVKPFECVGTREESVLAFLLSVNKDSDILSQPDLFDMYKQLIKQYDVQELKNIIFGSIDREHNIPLHLYIQLKPFISQAYEKSPLT